MLVVKLDPVQLRRIVTGELEQFRFQIVPLRLGRGFPDIQGAGDVDLPRRSATINGDVLPEDMEIKFQAPEIDNLRLLASLATLLSGPR